MNLAVGLGKVSVLPNPPTPSPTVVFFKAMIKKLNKQAAKSLIEAARRAMKSSYSRQSGFPVGAALLCRDGEVVTGCNVESDSLLQVFCAERVALLKALSAGKRDFTHVAVVAEKAAPCTPCGLCRQMLLEFAPEIIVLTEETTGLIVQRPLLDYLPHAFRGPDA